jgi:NarL family two-component system response regulator LiaR
MIRTDAVTDHTAEPARDEPALRVLVAHRYRGFAEALAERLGAERDLEVVALCTETRKVEAILSLERVDVLLVDWRFEEPDACNEIRWMRDLAPSVRVAVISSSDGASRAVAAARAGVRAWIQTSQPFDQLCDAIRGVSRGEMWFPPSFVTAALNELMRDEVERDASRDRIASLTVREREILRYLVAGLTRSDIARELYISADTVRTHVHNLLHRLGVHDSVAAVAIARRAGVKPWTPMPDVQHST